MYLFALLAAMNAAQPTARAPGTLKIAILNIAAEGGVTRNAANAFADMVQGAIRARGHSVISRSDIENMLGLEKLKDSLGCNTTSCLAEIGGALGVDEIITGSLSKVGSYQLIVIKRMNPKKGEVI